MPVQFHVNGLATIWTDVAESGTAAILGYSQDGVTIELHYETEDVHTDKWGPRIPEDILNYGQWATVKCSLIKYDMAQLQSLQGRIVTNGLGTPGSEPNVTGGVLDIGELMSQCEDFNQLWIQRVNPGCEVSTIEGGWKFGATYLADVDTFKVGTRVTMHDLTFRCLPNSSGVLFSLIGTTIP